MAKVDQSGLETVRALGLSIRWMHARTAIFSGSPCTSHRASRHRLGRALDFSHQQGVVE